MSQETKPCIITREEAIERGLIKRIKQTEEIVRGKSLFTTTDRYQTHNDFLERYNAHQRIALGIPEEGDVPFEPYKNEIMPRNLAGLYLADIDFSSKKVMFPEETNIRGTNFDRSNLSKIDLSNVTYVNENTSFNDVDLSKAILALKIIHETHNFRNANLTKTEISDDPNLPAEDYLRSYDYIKDIMEKRNTPIIQKKPYIGDFEQVLKIYYVVRALGLTMLTAQDAVSKDTEKSTEPLPESPVPTEMVAAAPQAPATKPLKTALSLTETGVFCSNAKAREDETINDICNARGFTQEIDIQP